MLNPGLRIPSLFMTVECEHAHVMPSKKTKKKNNADAKDSKQAPAPASKGAEGGGAAAAAAAAASVGVSVLANQYRRLRASPLARGTLLLPPTRQQPVPRLQDLQKGRYVELTLEVQVNIAAFAHNHLVDVYPTSLYAPVGPRDAVPIKGGHARVTVHIADAVPRGVLLHIILLKDDMSAQQTHRVHVQVACAECDLGLLSSHKPVDVPVVDQHDATNVKGTIRLTLSGALPTIDAKVQIERPTASQLTALLEAYSRDYTRKTWDKYANGVYYPNGKRLYQHVEAFDFVGAPQSLPFIVYLYRATRLRAPRGHVDEFADAQIRAGCLLSGITPQGLITQSGVLADEYLLFILCNAARALAWALSVYEEHRGSPYSAPLGVDSIGHFAGLCVEHSVLTATVLMHIRDGGSQLCRVFHRLLSQYRIGHILMTFWPNAPADVPAAYHDGRHMATVLIPRDTLDALNVSPDKRGVGGGGDSKLPVCMLDTVGNLPISDRVEHPGHAHEKESVVFSGLLRTEWTESEAYTGAPHYAGTAMSIFFVDDDTHIAQAACMTVIDQKARMGIPVHDFYRAGALRAEQHRLWCPLPMTPQQSPLEACRALVAETAYLSNVYQDTTHKQYLHDTSTIYTRLYEVLDARVASVTDVSKVGWRLDLYHYVPEESNSTLTHLMDKSLRESNSFKGLGVRDVQATALGDVIFCADVRVSVYLVTYLCE
jgi:hypothetical protein